MGRKVLAMAVLLASSQCMMAQTDSLDKENKLSIGMQFLTHGETCAGGLPRSEENKDGVDNKSEERSHFLLGRFRLNVDYERPGIQAHALWQDTSLC